MDSCFSHLLMLVACLSLWQLYACVACGVVMTPYPLGCNRLNTYMLFSKALLLSSSESAVDDHWLEVSSIKTELLSSGRAVFIWASWTDTDRQRGFLQQRPSVVDEYLKKKNMLRLKEGLKTAREMIMTLVASVTIERRETRRTKTKRRFRFR